jgi:hypothetical protein
MGPPEIRYTCADEYAGPVSRVLAEEKRVHSGDRRVQVYRLFRVFGAGFESPLII